MNQRPSIVLDYRGGAARDGPPPRLYGVGANLLAALVASPVGGLLAGGVLTAINYRQVGQHAAARRAASRAILGTAATTALCLGVLAALRYVHRPIRPGPAFWGVFGNQSIAGLFGTWALAGRFSRGVSDGAGSRRHVRTGSHWFAAGIGILIFLLMIPVVIGLVAVIYHFQTRSAGPSGGPSI